MTEQKSPIVPSSLIIDLDQRVAQGDISYAELDEYADQFEAAQDDYEYELEADRLADTYEMSGLMHYAHGNDDDAYQYFLASANQANGQGMYATNAEQWYKSINEQIENDKKRARKKSLVKRSVIPIAILLWVAAASWYDSDSAVIARADPQVIAIADSAGMTVRGKAIFAKTNPIITDIATIREQCNTASGEDSVELGCYDPSTNRIYIRDLPEDLNIGEITTAAHEMLHAAESRDGMNDTELASFRASLTNPATIKFLKSPLASYGEIDEETRESESLAFLGTTYQDLNPEMEAYYAKYFIDGRQAVLDSYKAVKNIFTKREKALESKLKVTLAALARAEVHYANHSYYASMGDRYNHQYSYSLYTQEFDSYNNQLQQYNADVETYNDLISRYTGASLDTLDPKLKLN